VEAFKKIMKIKTKFDKKNITISDEIKKKIN
jgi:hypothetical protein